MKKLIIILLGFLIATPVLALSTFQVTQGGTGATTLTGCLTGNGTSAITGSGTCSTFPWPFTKQLDNSQGTTTVMSFLGGFYSTASSTLTGSTTLATTLLTNGTSTNFAVTTLSPDTLVAANKSGGLVSTSTIGNNQLQNSAVTINAAGPLGGGGALSLGGTLNLTCTGCLTGMTFAWPFTKLSTNEQATSTTLSFQNGFLSMASSTVTNLLHTGSTTLQAFTGTTYLGLGSTTLQAVTAASSTVNGNFLTSFATSTTLAVTAIPNCDTIDTDSNGVLKCGVDASAGGSSFAWPFTKLSTNEQATSTTLAFLNGFLSTASSTFTSGPLILASTTLQAFTGTNYLALGSTTLQAMTSSSSTIGILLSNSASTTNLAVTTLTAGNCVQAGTGGTITTTGSACGSGGGSTFAFPFTSNTNYGATTMSTSTPLWFTAGFQASSTNNFLAGLTVDNALAGDSTLVVGTSSHEWTFGYKSSNQNFAISSSTVLGTNDALTIDKNLLTTLLGSFLVNGSSTLQNFTASNGTTTNATTTAFAITNLSAANCDVKALTTGVIYCGTDATGAGGGFAWPFTKLATNEQATSTTLELQNGFIATASSTFTTGPLILASSTLQAFTGTNYLALASTTLQNFTGQNATATMYALNNTTSNAPLRGVYTNTAGFVDFATNGSWRGGFSDIGIFAVGTSTPLSKLGQVQIASSTQPELSLQYGALVPAWYIDNDGGPLEIGTSSPSTNGTTTPALSILPTGTPSLAVGTTTPSAFNFFSFSGTTYGNALTVAGATSTSFYITTNGAIYAPNTTSSGSSQTGYWCYDAAGQLIRDTAVCLVSSIRFKEHVSNLDAGLAQVLKMHPVSFDYKKTGEKSLDSRGRQIGFIAEEALKVDPRLVEIGSDGKPRAFNYMTYTATLTKAIQQMWGEVTNLITWNKDQERRIKNLETENEQLKTRLDALEHAQKN